eukprot:gene1963-1897_t
MGLSLEGVLSRPGDNDPATPEMQVIEPFEQPESLEAWIAEMLKDLESGGGTLMSKEEGELGGERVAKVVGKADLPQQDVPQQQEGDAETKPVVLAVTLIWRSERPIMIRWACMEENYGPWQDRIDRITASCRFSKPAAAPPAPPPPAQHADPAAAATPQLSQRPSLRARVASQPGRTNSPPKPTGAAVAGMAAQRVAALQRKPAKPAAKTSSP